MLGVSSFNDQFLVPFAVQDGVALPTTGKTLPFGGEVSTAIELIVNSELAVRTQRQCISYLFF